LIEFVKLTLFGRLWKCKQCWCENCYALIKLLYFGAYVCLQDLEFPFYANTGETWCQTKNLIQRLYTAMNSIKVSDCELGRNEIPTDHAIVITHNYIWDYFALQLSKHIKSYLNGTHYSWQKFWVHVFRYHEDYDKFLENLNIWNHRSRTSLNGEDKVEVSIETIINYTQNRICNSDMKERCF